jgi:undecaprenyl-diphosphatase
MGLQSKLVFLLLVCCFLCHTESFAKLDMAPDENASLIGYGDAFIFGLVEGITEFLPISSTGHLILTKEWILGASEIKRVEQDAINSYLIVIQVGAIFAVALLYSRRIVAVLMGFIGLDPVGKKLGINLLMAFVPAAVLGPLLDEWIESFLFGKVPVSVALILGAFLMLWAEKRKRRSDGYNGDAGKKLEDLNMKDSLLVGLLQCVAMCPGTSRSMMTIVGGYLVGLTRRHAAEFSFLLGLITLTAAAAYKALTSGEALALYLNFGPMLFGCLIAGISAAISVHWLVGYLSRHGLSLFVWYRIGLGFLILTYYWFSST